MKSKILKTIPVVFSLRSSDYSKHVVTGDASKMMRDTWAGLGLRLNASIEKVARDAAKAKR